MANELRVRQLAIGGLVEDNPLGSAATTLTSAGLAAVAGGIGSTQHLAVVLDPDGIDGAPEIAYVTALTAGAGSATVARGQEGTTARQHAAGTPWVHAPTLRDVGTFHKSWVDSDTTFSNSAALNTLATLAVPTDLAAGDRLHLVAFGEFTNNTGGTRWFTNFLLALGATTLSNNNSNGNVATGAQPRPWSIESWIDVVAPASAQRAYNILRWGSANTADGWAANQALLFNGTDYATAAEDLTAGKNLVIQAQMDSAAAAFSVTLHAAHLEVIPKG